jgi:hypothetical protein
MDTNFVTGFNLGFEVSLALVDVCLSWILIVYVLLHKKIKPRRLLSERRKILYGH